jgi:GTP-binding protein HflX
VDSDLNLWRTPISKNNQFQITQSPLEKAFLVGYEMKYSPNQQPKFSVEDSLEELATLARTADLQVEGGTYQRLEHINPNTLIGSGKVEELQHYRDEMGIEVFLFDDELTPRQQRELEKQLTVKVVDRTALILDIFARHARTHEGQLQVELAQYEYRLPRLTRLWTHLARQAGGRAGGASGGVGVRGPGETQLEVDRREIGHKIAHLKRELEKVRAHRSRHRQQRQQAGVPIVALVGYTNAGKSTLLNTLTHANVYTADQLFATLDPTTRRVTLPKGTEILLSDTVGFIQKLPTGLVAAFRATLEGIAEADLLLHVVDVTHPNAFEQAATVNQTLYHLDVGATPTLVALNKIDRLADPDEAVKDLAEFPNSLAISAANGHGLSELLTKIETVLRSSWETMNLRIPYQRSDLVSMLHAQAVIQEETHQANGTHVEAQVPPHLVGIVAPFRA